MKKIIIVLILIIIIIPLYLVSVPQYSMITGNRCISCHDDANGGSKRDFLGWYSKSDVSLIKPESIGLGPMYKHLQKSNQIIDDMLSYGLDFRYLSAKLGGPATNEREYFVMQATPYLYFKPIEWLSFSGQYNFSDRGYPGQEFWTASAKIQPSLILPELRIGYIKPSIGVRHDDHTSLIRQVAGVYRANQVIPPDYAEFGAEINYYGFKWLNLTAGVYNSENLSKIAAQGPDGQLLTLADNDILSGLARVEFWPRFFDNNLNTQIGASYFFNGNYKVADFFLNLGLTDRLALLTEYVYSKKTGARTTDNYMIELDYQYSDPLIAYLKYEKGNTGLYPDSDLSQTYINNQYIIGLRAFLLPFMEIRPEYRIFDREHVDSYAAQYVLQMHLFY